MDEQANMVVLVLAELEELNRELALRLERIGALLAREPPTISQRSHLRLVQSRHDDS